MNDAIIQKIKERRKRKCPLQLKYDINLKKNIFKDKTINTSYFIIKKLSGYYYNNKKNNLTAENDYISKSKIIKKNLKKHNITPKKFEKKIINGLIFDGKSHVISLFKDLLFWNDDVECFKRIYKKKESIYKIKKFEEFYRLNYNSLKIFPIFFHLGDCSKVLFKYYQIKYKLQKEIIKEKKRRKNKILNFLLDKKKEKFSKIINIQSQSHCKVTSLSLNLSKENLNDINKYNDIYSMKKENNLSNKKITTRNLEKNNLSFSYDDDTVKSILKNLTKNFSQTNNNNNNILINNINNLNNRNNNQHYKFNNKEILKNYFNENEKNYTNNCFINTISNKKKRNNQKFVLKVLSTNNSFSKLPILTNTNKKKEESVLKKLKIPLNKKKNNFCFTDRGNFLKEKKTIKIINTNENINRYKLKFKTTNVSPVRLNKNVLIFPYQKKKKN